MLEVRVEARSATNRSHTFVAKKDVTDCHICQSLLVVSAHLAQKGLRLIVLDLQPSEDA